MGPYVPMASTARGATPDHMGGTDGWDPMCRILWVGPYGAHRAGRHPKPYGWNLWAVPHVWDPMGPAHMGGSYMAPTAHPKTHRRDPMSVTLRVGPHGAHR